MGCSNGNGTSTGASARHLGVESHERRKGYHTCPATEYTREPTAEGPIVAAQLLVPLPEAGFGELMDQRDLWDIYLGE